MNPFNRGDVFVKYKLSLFLAVSCFLFCPAAHAGLAEDGISLYDAGRYREATVAFEEALIKERKNDPNVMYYYALSLQKSGQAGKSYGIFHRIATIAPGSRAAAYARQAMGLAPVGGKKQTTKTSTTSNTATQTKTTTANTSAPKGAPLPFDCPVGMYPGSRMNEATDQPAKLYGFKKIKLQAITTPEKVLAYYEAELKNNTDWKLREKRAGVETDKPNPEGNKMCGELTYLSQSNAAWTKQFSIIAAAPELKPASDVSTIIEITLYDKSHYQ